MRPTTSTNYCDKGQVAVLCGGRSGAFHADPLAGNVCVGSRDEANTTPDRRNLAGQLGGPGEIILDGARAAAKFRRHLVPQLQYLARVKKCVENLRRYHRPLVCTEYMARPVGSTFDPNLKYLRDQHVGAYNWGFVSGKTQTIYPWDSWEKAYTAEPPLWFHDIFRSNGVPYDAREVNYIKSVTPQPALAEK